MISLIIPFFENDSFFGNLFLGVTENDLAEQILDMTEEKQYQGEIYVNRNKKGHRSSYPRGYR